MDALPSFWTLVPGVFAGCFAVGRVGRWILLLIAVLGRDPGRPAVVLGPLQRAPLFLAIVVHPVPWLVLIGTGLGVHRLFGGPIGAAWIWFFSGFFLGPVLLMALLYSKIARIRRKQARGSDPPCSDVPRKV
jgi:hypothetical protein